ncbi:MAG: hypothetical protein EP330_24400 [Deltaproteobacteria bacterium]|nr:MAG: hypothetical protein EP330_24400 [Deltaproteobacteria bacterium]
MAPFAPDPSPSQTLRRWRRRPVLHLAAAVLAGGPLLALVLVVSSEGLSSLWPIVTVILAGALAGMVVLQFDGAVAAKPVTWRESSLETAEIEVPPPPGDSDEAAARAALTVWAGWLAALAVFAAQQAHIGALSIQRMLEIGLFGGWLGIPAMWLGSLLPLLAVRVLAREPRGVLVRLDAHRIRIGRRELTLGRADQDLSLDVEDGRARLRIAHAEGSLVLEGSRLHVEAVARRIRELPDAGEPTEIPEAMDRLRGRQPEG